MESNVSRNLYTNVRHNLVLKYSYTTYAATNLTAFGQIRAMDAQATYAVHLDKHSIIAAVTPISFSTLRSVAARPTAANNANLLRTPASALNWPLASTKTKHQPRHVGITSFVTMATEQIISARAVASLTVKTVFPLTHMCAQIRIQTVVIQS